MREKLLTLALVGGTPRNRAVMVRGRLLLWHRIHGNGSMAFS